MTAERMGCATTTTEEFIHDKLNTLLKATTIK